MIPATCAFSSSAPLMLKRRPLLRDEGFYMISLIALILIIWDGLVVFSECIMLVTIYLVYLSVVIFATPVRRYYRKFKGLVVKDHSGFSEKIGVETAIDLQQPLISPAGELVSADDTAKELLNNEEEGDSDSFAGKAIKIFAFPLSSLFKITCPNAEEGARFENLYLLTFTMTFVWVSVFSFVLSSIIERWVKLSGIYMAVANCQGTQVINIALGLGLPWLLMCGSSAIVLSKDLLVAAFIQCGVVTCNLSMFLGVAICTGNDKVRLDGKKAGFLYATYTTAIAIFIVVMWRTGKLQQ